MRCSWARMREQCPRGVRTVSPPFCPKWVSSGLVVGSVCQCAEPVEVASAVLLAESRENREG